MGAVGRFHPFPEKRGKKASDDGKMCKNSLKVTQGRGKREPTCLRTERH